MKKAITILQNNKEVVFWITIAAVIVTIYFSTDAVYR